MADIFNDGMTRVSFVATISNQNAPTVAELNAGVALTLVLTPKGLVGFEPDTATVDTSSLASTFDTKGIGRDQFDKTRLQLKKQSGTDAAYTTLTRGTTGHVVIRRDVAWDTAWTATQAVEVYPIICGTRSRLAPEANTVAMYEVPTPICAAPSLSATVA